MPLKDLSGKTIYDLEIEDFEKLFCQRCQDYEHCSRDEKKILSCKAFIDSGLWDKFYRNN